MKYEQRVERGPCVRSEKYSKRDNVPCVFPTTGPNKAYRLMSSSSANCKVVAEMGLGDLE